ncbi:hypothetical protein E2K93_11375 [Thalassotalea sp. HSM 43]|uniref:DUF7661 family protein n=1 Tax=Thalassotalea sp. HSM 43 TaxID=2552945 RepID=UPI001081FF4F|nr:hypothetical protein [Thalassotalea sp. HSM 43]QBY04946.1 hypothetical protein E2K93_11375 [Thalassotalea sp. HSM 43]
MNSIRFLVFGNAMQVKRVAQQWQLFDDPQTGIGRRIYDVYIPDDLNQEQLTRFLADMFHESATVEHPDVIVR